MGDLNIIILLQTEQLIKFIWNINIEKMKREIIIHYKRKKIKIIAKDCNVLQKFIGLMFSRRENARMLLFSFKKKQKIRIHSWYVFYPFIAVWLDERNRVVDLKIVKPFTPWVSPKKRCISLLEIPINLYYKNLIKRLFPTTRRNI